NSTLSTIDSTRSTSPPKSACPGVSTMLMCVPCQLTAQFFARMVMPRSRSRSLLSITRSAICWLSRKVPLWRSSWSTSVVLPWSTWAMMAMLRICLFMVSCGDQGLHFEGAEKAVGDQLARGDVRTAEKGARLGTIDANRRRIGLRDAAAQAGQKAACVVVVQMHRRPVADQRIGRRQQRIAPCFVHR